MSTCIYLGMETLSLRVERHVENALALAEWLDARDDVAWVSYPGLKSHPYHEPAKKYLNGFCGLITIGVKGSLKTFIESVDIASHLGNVNDAKILVIAPSLTTHAPLNDEESHYCYQRIRFVFLLVEHLDDIK